MKSQAGTSIPPQDFGANTWVVEELYRDYLADPSSVGESWREFFSDYQPSWRPERPALAASEEVPKEATRLRGTQAVIAQNMMASLGVPTATSIRVVPAKLLEVNRLIMNNQLARTRGGKVSFTHLIGWAVIRAMERNRAMTSSYVEVDGTAYVRRPDHINLGIAIDVERKDGRTLLVPNIKRADTLDFLGFWRAYEEVIRRVRERRLGAELFADTTATITNPGTVGTVGSIPRLMAGQSAIVGVGAIDYPVEYQGADPRRLAEIGVGKVLTITSTYDHRVIQGAESGLFLKTIHELLLGDHDFYDEVFTSLRMPYPPVRWHRDENAGLWADGEDRLAKQMAVGQLINAYRVRGHLIANLNPLSHTYQPIHAELDVHTYGLTIWDLDREFATGGLAGRERMTLGAILSVLRDAYCRTIGVEYMHIQEPAQKRWLQDHLEGVSTQLKDDEQRHILSRLNAAEAFERFLHSKYLGHKRFSLEGAESAIPMLDALLTAAAGYGITDAVIGMAHRGRLNVLANIIGKSYRQIFREFEGDLEPDSVQGSGDVKYHLGASGVHRTPDGAEVSLELASNPSHLEAVDPVVVGMARAKLDQRAPEERERGVVLPIIVHGDAAFAGQGVAAETFALSQLHGYWTRGTVHLVINNQLGFTTAPHQARSSQYATDVAKIVQAPIFHVNGDDPEACVRVMRLALDFRQRFAKDVVVDMICYRRWGHNETDEPSYTQPIMYAAIEGRRSVRKLYTEELVNRGDLSIDEAEEALSDFRDRLERALQRTRESTPPQPPRARRPEVVGVLPHIETGIDRAVLDRIITAVTSWPDDFVIHPKLRALLERRRESLSRDAVDWATAEALAFGSLLLEGFPVRLAGEDSRRGTFSQRHAVLVHYENEHEHTPLANLDPSQAPFMIYDSPLSEFAAMGFEYGYSVARKNALVCWEAQFGDFANGAQVIIDEFLVSAGDKWRQSSGLVLLLPHGYEGQGPDHSSARLERFLTLAAEDNIQITQPTSAAQYFHLLRRQMHRDGRKPLVVLTPKALLRAAAAASPAAAFTAGSFEEVLADPGDAFGDPGEVQRVLLCSGKIAYDLMKRRDELGARVAVVRVEQLYPWPGRQILNQLERYPAADVVWVQDEPKNQGAWLFAYSRLHQALHGANRALRHVCRFESGSPATGSKIIHEQEHAEILDEAFAGVDGE